ncbi:60S ribosomal protein L44 [Dirofilaria immitis]|nr:60S ribosomal protein L44 [Dirofilaria immitis]
MVNVPKTRRTFCDGKCRRHTMHKVTQYKKARNRDLRRVDDAMTPNKKEKAKTTKKIVLRMECTECKHRKQLPIKRCKHFELGGQKKTRGQTENRRAVANILLNIRRRMSYDSFTSTGIYHLTPAAMVVTIAYCDKPDEILHSFSKVGDSVCIGRDKRKCKIALGVDAQGVSRVHLKLELLSNGRLFARDTSTYGTGYDGGPLMVEREKELKLSVVLQEFILLPVFYVISLWKFIATGLTMKDEFVSDLNSSMNVNEIWMQEQDRKLIAKLEKEVKKLDRKSGENKSEVSTFTCTDCSENMGLVTRVSLQCDSSKEFRQIMTESPVNDSILAGAKEDETLDDIDAEKLSKPLFSSTQLTSFQEILTKSVNERSAAEENNIPIFRAEQFSGLLESQDVSEKFCSLLFKAMPKQKDLVPPKVINRQDTIITRFISYLDMNTAKKRSNQSNSDETEIIAKHVKMEIAEDGNERQGSEKNENLIGSRTECEVSAGEDDQPFGINVETLRMKLVSQLFMPPKLKTVEYKNLERPTLTKIGSQSETNLWQEFNCKRFRKRDQLVLLVLVKEITEAAQGSHNACWLLHSTITRIIGVTDLIDFKQIA